MNTTGNYGPRWTEGILTDHLDAAVEAGLQLRAQSDGTAILTNSDGDSWQLVCSDVVLIATEDGPITGRCGEPAIRNANGEFIWCRGHDMPEWGQDCPHGMSAALCAGPGHYPMDM